MLKQFAGRGLGSRCASSFLLLLILLVTCSFGQAAEGVRELDLRVNALIYDPFTAKLYGTTSNLTAGLIQLDPQTGEILRSFDVGTNATRLERGAGNGLWIGLSGAGAVRRFNLETMTAEEPIMIEPGAEILDISPSLGDPYTMAVSITGPRAYVIKGGTLLPESIGLHYIALYGNYVIGQTAGRLTRAILGPNGLRFSDDITNMPVFGDGEEYNGLFYHNHGIIVDTAQLKVTGRWLLGYGRGATAFIDRENNTFYSLLNGETLWSFHRLNATTGVRTGYYEFPVLEPLPFPRDRSLAVWNTNSAAFHTASKVYLLDLNVLFVPADLEIMQTATPESTPFGSQITLAITVTNKGPGAALGVTLTNSMDPLVIARGGSGWEGASPIVPAHSAVTSVFNILPSRPGELASRASVSSDNDPNGTNNSSVLTVPVLSNSAAPIERVGIRTRDIAYDPVSRRVFTVDGNDLWVVSPEPLQILPPMPNPTASRVSISEAGGTVYVASDVDDRFRPVVYRFNTTTFASTANLSVGGIIDMAVSPVDPTLVAIANTTGTYLYKDGVRVENGYPEAWNIDFSSDGSRIYRSNPEDCSVDAFSITAAGLAYEETIPSLSCADFIIRNDLLYFDSGKVYDPAEDEQSGPLLPAPSFAVSSTPESLEVLSRIEGVWTLRRLRIPGFEEFGRIAVTNFTSPPLDMVPAGEGRVAIRTALELVMAGLPADPASLRVAILPSGSGTLLVRFTGVVGAKYRIERSDHLPPAWTTVRDSIDGEIGPVEEEISTDSGPMNFYRVIRTL